ncbi:MAG: hypothetical protein ABIK28_20475 [Planctomycetota bacterium]
MKKDPEIERLESEVREAWRNRPAPQIPESWMGKVMDSVHNAARSDPVPAAINALQRIAWKCAALSACAALAFLAFVPDKMLHPSDALVRLIMQDPAGFLRNLPFDF